MGQHQPLLTFIFSLLKQTSLQILQQINVRKCPSSIRCRDLNPRPLEHESPNITTRPGLPPIGFKVVSTRLFSYPRLTDFIMEQ